MPYTLVKFALWFGVAALVGGVIGWALRSLRCRSEVASVRQQGGDDGVELSRLQARVATLDAVAAERDRLRAKLADLRRTVDDPDDDDPDGDDPDGEDPAAVDPDGDAGSSDRGGSSSGGGSSGPSG